MLFTESPISSLVSYLNCSMKKVILISIAIQSSFNINVTQAQLDPPILLSPPDSSIIFVTSPRLDWTDVNNINSYNIHISYNREFTMLVVQILGIQESHYKIANPYLNFDTQYYWRVRGSSTTGYGPWSGIFSFKALNIIPPVPVLQSPVNGATHVSVHPTLDWNDVGEIHNYRLQVSLNPNFSPLVFNPGIEIISQYTITNTLPYNTTYYWRVNSTASAGTSDWSSVFNFTTIPAPIPGAPNLISPLNNSQGISLTPTLRWSLTSNSSSHYVNLSLDSAFSTILFDSLVPNNNLIVSVPSGILIPNTRYYWRVNASSSGGTGPWSSIWNFQTTISNIFQINSIIPEIFKLNHNYPNPFNPLTRFTFEIPEVTFVSIEVFDYNGRKILQLASGFMSAGKYEVKFDGSNFASGAYFYRVTTSSNSETGKMILLK